MSPNKTRTIIIGFLGGALLAMVLIAVKFLSDDRIMTAEDISKVGNLATLGLIPLQDMDQNDNNDGSSSKKPRKRTKRDGKE